MDHCDEYLDLISAAIDGALSPDGQQKLNAHLDVCPRCRVLYDELEALHNALADLPAPPAPTDLTDRIMAAVAADNIIPLPVKKAPVHQWRKWTAAAAVLAVILAGAWTASRPEGAVIQAESVPENEWLLSVQVIDPPLDTEGLPEDDEADAMTVDALMLPRMAVSSAMSPSNKADLPTSGDTAAGISALPEDEQEAKARILAYLDWPDDCIPNGVGELRLISHGLQLDGLYYYFEIWDIPPFTGDAPAGSQCVGSYVLSVESGEILTRTEATDELFGRILKALEQEP